KGNGRAGSMARPGVRCQARVVASRGVLVACRESPVYTPAMAPPTVNLMLASDLHLDVGHYDLAGHITRQLEEGRRIDAVVLAGDIVEVAGGDPVAYAATQVPPHIPAAFIPGNHD